MNDHRGNASPTDAADDTQEAATALLDSLADQLMLAVEVCSHNGISFPRVWDEVEDALDTVPQDLPTEWRTELRRYLSDYVASAFMNVSTTRGEGVY